MFTILQLAGVMFTTFRGCCVEVFCTLGGSAGFLGVTTPIQLKEDVRFPPGVSPARQTNRQASSEAWLEPLICLSTTEQSLKTAGPTQPRPVLWGVFLTLP